MLIKVGKSSCFSVPVNNFLYFLKACYAKIAKLARSSLRQTRFLWLRFAKKNYEIVQSHSKTRQFTTLNRYSLHNIFPIYIPITIVVFRRIIVGILNHTAKCPGLDFSLFTLFNCINNTPGKQGACCFVSQLIGMGI